MKKVREGPLDLPYPIQCESVNLDGRWILVNLLRYLGNEKWLAYNEDGDKIVVDASTLRRPTWE
jgi:hypothetical protein